MDECSPVSNCMHICENTPGGYNCKCNEDFKVDPTDAKQCIREYYFGSVLPLFSAKRGRGGGGGGILPGKSVIVHL